MPEFSINAIKTLCCKKTLRMCNSIVDRLKQIEIISSFSESMPILKTSIMDNQLDIFCWLTANCFINFLTTFWYYIFFENSPVAKDLLNIAFVIFVNSYLFSLIPHIENSKKKDEHSLNNIMKYFNVISIAISILIPFLLLNDCSNLTFYCLTILLILLSLFHFIYQNYCKDAGYHHKKLSLNENLPTTSKQGDRIA